MKLSILGYFVLILFVFSSCQKGSDLKVDESKETKDWNGKDKTDDAVEICEWDGSKVSDPEVWEEYIVEELVTDEECGCIVEGVVKYVKIESDFAYVIYYGKGECDAWAYLVTYYEGEDKKEKKCKFKMDCNDSE